VGPGEKAFVNLSEIGLPESFDTFDWFMLILRVAFIALVYFFLYQVARVSVRELVVFARAGVAPSAAQPALPDPRSSLELIDPVESSYYEGTSFPLDHYTTVGRAADNSIAIDDGFVSSSHAEIVFDQEVWWLQDLGSTNGTFVNNQPVRSRVRISNGDILQFGRVRLRAHV
jgi:hypothetical protein